jgi:hypothetical protein
VQRKEVLVKSSAYTLWLAGVGRFVEGLSDLSQTSSLFFGNAMPQAARESAASLSH